VLREDIPSIVPCLNAHPEMSLANDGIADAFPEEGAFGSLCGNPFREDCRAVGEEETAESPVWSERKRAKV